MLWFWSFRIPQDIGKWYQFGKQTWIKIWLQFIFGRDLNHYYKKKNAKLINLTNPEFFISNIMMIPASQNYLKDLGNICKLLSSITNQWTPNKCSCGDKKSHDGNGDIWSCTARGAQLLTCFSISLCSAHSEWGRGTLKKVQWPTSFIHSALLWSTTLLAWS